jgi:sec-independent protein translocase protein TatA
MEIILLLLLALLLFGAKRLPEIGRSLGSGMREFKDSVTGNDSVNGNEKPEPTTYTESTYTELPAATQDTAAPAPPRENETVL